MTDPSGEKYSSSSDPVPVMTTDDRLRGLQNELTEYRAVTLTRAQELFQRGETGSSRYHHGVADGVQNCLRDLAEVLAAARRDPTQTPARDSAGIPPAIPHEPATVGPERGDSGISTIYENVGLFGSRSPDGDGPTEQPPQREPAIVAWVNGLPVPYREVDNAVAGSEPADSHSPLEVSGPDAPAPPWLEAAEKILQGFDDGILIRNTLDDGTSGWAIRLAPYIGALSQLQTAVDAQRKVAAPAVSSPPLSTDAIWKLARCEEGGVLVMTKEGTMHGRDGDWLIRGVQGELYPCKPDIFAETYDRVESASSARRWKGCMTPRERARTALTFVSPAGSTVKLTGLTLADVFVDLEARLADAIADAEDAAYDLGKEDALAAAPAGLDPSALIAAVDARRLCVAAMNAADVLTNTQFQACHEAEDTVAEEADRYVDALKAAARGVSQEHP